MAYGTLGETTPKPCNDWYDTMMHCLPHDLWATFRRGEKNQTIEIWIIRNVKFAKRPFSEKPYCSYRYIPCKTSLEHGLGRTLSRDIELVCYLSRFKFRYKP